MSLTLMRPFAEMDKMMEGFDQPFLSLKKGDWMPAVDVEETEVLYMIRAELPGVKKSDVHVGVENNILVIKGEKKSETTDTKRHRIESSYGSFVRSFTLPTTLDYAKIEAKFVDGVLSLEIPKMEAKEKLQYEVHIN